MLATIHGRVALSAVFFAFALGVWATVAFLRGEQVSPSFRGALIIGELLMLAQGALGILMVLGGTFPPDLLHFLYGFLVALSWPAVYIYTNARMGRSELGYYALVSFFVFGLAIRAVMTG